MVTTDSTGTGNLKNLHLSLMTLYAGKSIMSFAAVQQSPTVLGVSLTLPPEIPDSGELLLLNYNDDHLRQERCVWWVRSD